MTEIRELIENPHSIFEANHNYWNFLLESYEGGPDYCKGLITQTSGVSAFKNWAFKIFAGSREMKSFTRGNLFMHPKERNEDYNDRLRMSYYYNFCSPIIDIYTDHLFKQEIDANFDDIEKEVEARSDNIDNKESSIGEFRKEVADLSQLYGHIFVVTDKPRFLGEVKTKKDEIDNNLFPYFTLKHPQNVLNWALDEFGRPYWVVVREFLDGNQNPFTYNKDATQSVQYRLWTRQEWVLYNNKYDIVDTAPHNLGFVPITCIFDKQSKKQRNFLGISSIADIAFIARDVYNSCSELKQILRDQTFAFLAIQGVSSEYDALSVGTCKALLYPEGRNPPQYISPPSANAEVYFKHIDRQVGKIFQLAKLEGGSASFKGENAVQESGVSKAWDFNQTNSALSKKAGNLEDGETKLWQTFAKWAGKKGDKVSIAYPNEFSIKSLNEDLDEAEKMMRLALGAEFQKEIKSAIIKKKFPRMSKEDLDRLVENMEANEIKAEEGESGRLFKKIPSLNNMAEINARQGGK